MSKQSNALQKYTPTQLFKSGSIEKRFQQVLGEKANGFVASVLQAINDSKMLAEADSQSVYNAAMTAAVLDLPINPNLGFAYIIPYRNKGGTVAQFQMGYKGFIQLCQRSGQFKTISATEIYEGQVVEENPLTGFEFNFNTKQSDTVIGYASYFALINGFEKTFYMTTEQVEAHAKEYSQAYRKGYGPWKDDFDSMAIKTVLKLLLSKYAPMSTEMQKAVMSDQAVVDDADKMEVSYVDNPKDRQAIDTEPANGQAEGQPQEVQQEPPPAEVNMNESYNEEGLPFE